MQKLIDKIMSNFRLKNHSVYRFWHINEIWINNKYWTIYYITYIHIYMYLAKNKRLFEKKYIYTRQINVIIHAWFVGHWNGIQLAEKLKIYVYIYYEKKIIIRGKSTIP